MTVNVGNNPASHQFELYIRNITSKGNLRVFDCNGRLIDTMEIPNGNKVVSIGANYRSGLYFAQITGGGKTRVVKLVKL